MIRSLPRTRIVLLFAFAVSLLSACGSDSRKSARGAVAPADCETSTRAAVLAFGEKQMDFYRSHGGSLPPADGRTTYLPGTNGRAVVVVHGFLSSPAAMLDLAKEIQGAGYSVVMPLLTGFGDGPDSANAATAADWKAAVNEAIDEARLCHNEVSVVAHSLGTALVAQALAEGADRKLQSVVFLAPFFRAYRPWLSYVSEILSTRSDTVYLSSVSRYVNVDLYNLFALERPKAGEREPYLPLKAMREALALPATFTLPVDRRLTIPVLSFLNEADSVVDSQYAATYISGRFENARFVNYPEAEKLSHSFEQRAFNPHFTTMVSQILDALAAARTPAAR